jgi:hypothetical protein
VQGWVEEGGRFSSVQAQGKEKTIANNIMKLMKTNYFIILMNIIAIWRAHDGARMVADGVTHAGSRRLVPPKAKGKGEESIYRLIAFGRVRKLPDRLFDEAPMGRP